MADQGSSQWRGKGQSGVSRVQPTGAPPDGGEGSYAPLASDGPVKALLGDSAVRNPSARTTDSAADQVDLYTTVSRTATPRSLTVVTFVIVGDSSESYTILRVSV